MVVSASGLTWKRWGSGSASATKNGTIIDCASCNDGVHPVDFKFVAYRRARHNRDGCGHTRSDRIYTRPKIIVTGPADSAYFRTWVLKLPKTGCETS